MFAPRELHTQRNVKRRNINLAIPSHGAFIVAASALNPISPCAAPSWRSHRSDPFGPIWFSRCEPLESGARPPARNATSRYPAAARAAQKPGASCRKSRKPTTTLRSRAHHQNTGRIKTPKARENLRAHKIPDTHDARSSLHSDCRDHKTAGCLSRDRSA